ncbi:putative signal transducing protein [Limnobacter sp.]|uniref:putative signal transducing protein n=1 Tax=Limnobacter sp. TaxID=2003368 RepID=UPI003518AC0F
MHLVFQADNLIEAHIVAGVLRSCELSVHVGGHYLQGGVGDLSPAGMVCVYVIHSEHIELAQQLLTQYLEQPVDPTSPIEQSESGQSFWQGKPA